MTEILSILHETPNKQSIVGCLYVSVESLCILSVTYSPEDNTLVPIIPVEDKLTNYVK